MPKPSHGAKMRPLESARWYLGVMWFSGAALIVLLLIIQSLAGVYEDRVQGVWGWALPNFLPTLMLMLGVFAGAALVEEAESDKMRVRSPFLKLALGLSGFHLVAVLLTLLAQPLVPSLSNGTQTDQLAVFEMSNLWLGPTQGLVAAAIGALFFSKTSQSDQMAPVHDGKTGKGPVPNTGPEELPVPGTKPEPDTPWPGAT